MVSLNDDASSQHSSDLSDTRTEHSDDDLVERTTKKTSTVVKTTKKPAAKTEVSSVISIFFYLSKKQLHE